ncbi:FecCD family ABC transporter permease [Catenuloplanes atrovinosus]|uniref:Iron complex transport system permease protein n=1 Tax=Catenuloplanes atrovinosus TaxID=137266 RepID=A0AAE4C773_9ACTN|nr:iron chelate uptake ABC transporter family permease subunit [Catenuloplanes atrovinosus]MDR7273538.1 iron complex transport system permease protein [Catenuloplanes atrovinosus]
MRLRIPLRAVLVTAGLFVTLIVMAGFTMTTGDFRVPIGDVLLAVTGDAPPAAEFVVNTLRLPRLLVATLAGAGLGVAGAVMQSLSRNQLGSPDMIGFSQGAATGGIAAILLTASGTVGTSIGAAAGGLATALLILALVGRHGLNGYRLVLVGVGISTVLMAFNGYLITRATFGDAQRAVAWQVGNVSGRGWDHVTLVAVALAVLLPVVLLYNRRMSMLELGDDTATALGVGVLATRLVPLLAAILLVSAAAAMAGPIPFVALAAPHLARRLTRNPGPNVLPAAVTGGLLTVASDFAAQHALQVQLPVGIVTSVFGGVYLVILLIVQRGGRRS